MKGKFFFILCFLLSLAPVVKAVQVFASDTATHAVKNFDAAKIEAYRHNSDFIYQETEESEPGLFSAISRYLRHFFNRLFEARVGNIDLLDVILYGLIVFAAIMLVLHVFKISPTGLFVNTPVKLPGFSAATEDIKETDFDKLIEEAKAAGNYRLAVRMFYLSCLKKLHGASLINWQPNKTNFEYYYELRGENLRKQFYDLTLVFESTWYGNQEIGETVFSQNAEAFTNFLQAIKN